jgi:membrane protease YdiL (CAAX protease family)
MRTLRRYPLFLFFGISYGLTWAYELVMFVALGRRPNGLLIVPALLGPSVATWTATALIGGRDGFHRLLHRYVQWRVPARWYVFVLIGVPLAYFLGAVILARGLPANRAPPVRLVRFYVSSFVITFLFGGPLFEEPGWRGFALPRLQERHGPLAGSLILGLLWGGWHLPLYLVPDWAAQNGGTSAAGIAVFLACTVAFTVIMTYVFNCTRGSLLLAMLLHTSINTFQPVVNMFYPDQATGEVNALIGTGMLAVLLVIATNGRLSHKEHVVHLNAANVL